MNAGGFYYITLPHELGHALGLAHPHNGGGAWNFSPYNGNFGSELYPGVSSNASTSGGNNYLNSTPYSVMTYNDVTSTLATPNSQNIDKNVTPRSYVNYGYNEGLGAFDIATLQYLYGPNTTKSTGNTTYYLDTSTLNGYQTIWDNGGTDTITAANSSAAVYIDLRSATLQDEAGGGGYLSRVDDEYIGYTIAYNTTGTAAIENAIGSAQNDRLTGNSSNNSLSGGTGDDTLIGGAGDDTFVVDSTSDVVTESSSEGTDLIQASVTYTAPVQR